MFISSTVLYFGEDPVGYDLYKRVEGFVLKPRPATGGFAPPLIKALPTESSWRVAGVEDEDVQQQVIKLVEMHEVLRLSGEMTAAM